MICPFCKEEIMDDAIKCKHCQSDLGQSESSGDSSNEIVSKTNDFISRTENRDLTAQARKSLQGLWGLVVGATFVHIIITLVLQRIPTIGQIASMIITGPFTVGFCILYLSISRSKPHSFSQIFEGFSRFGTAFGAYFFMGLFTILWSLLLIIPGIIAAISYSMTYFIIADNPNLGALAAIKKSKEIMQGNKWKAFCLGWRFFGWSLLGILSCGIGFLWILPYMGMSYTKFYQDIIKN